MNRIPNPRQFPDGSYFCILKEFLNYKEKHFNLLVLGDSQPAGAGYHYLDIFSGIINKNNGCDVLNLAFIDGRVNDAILISQYLEEKGFLFDHVVFNINQSHFKNPSKQHIKSQDRDKYYSIEIAKNPFAFYKVLSKSQYNGHHINGETLHVEKYDYDYLNTDSTDLYDSRLKELALEISKISNNIHFYYTPYAPTAIEFNNYDMTDIERNINHFSEVVEKIGFNFYDFSNEFSDDDFFDIVHFNQNGHQKLKELLLNEFSVCN